VELQTRLRFKGIKTGPIRTRAERERSKGELAGPNSKEKRNATTLKEMERTNVFEGPETCISSQAGERNGEVSIAPMKGKGPVSLTQGKKKKGRQA